MLVRVLIFTFLFALSPLDVSGATIVADSCSYTHVNDAVTAAANGDTIVIPDGSCTWDTRLTITKAIALIGQNACTLDGDGRPLDGCPTVITDSGLAAAPLISWTLVSGYAHRLSQLQFVDGGRTANSGNGILIFSCTNQGATTLQIDHIRTSFASTTVDMQLTRCAGVIHNNAFVPVTAKNLMQVYGSGWYGLNGEAPTASSDNGDNSWYQSVDWSAALNASSVSQWLYVENNLFQSPTERGCTDGYAGARFVLRFNDFVLCNAGWHGTDSTGRARATRAVQVYNNLFDFSTSSGSRNWMVENRDGSSLVWGNSALNFVVNSDTAAIHMRNYRGTTDFQPWGPADGYNVIDSNDGGNPFTPTGGGANCSGTTCTATSAGSTTVTVSGASWTPNEWANYVIHQLTKSGGTADCLDDVLVGGNYVTCYSPILSNTADTITFAPNGFSGYSNVTFAASDTFELVKITAAMDQPGRGGGSLWPAAMGSTTCTFSTPTATCTRTAHGLSTNDYVVLAVTPFSAGYAAKPRQITVTGANTFTFPCPECDGNNGTGGSTSKVPAGWNDQVNFPIYQWLNQNTRSMVDYNLTAIVAKGSSIRANEHYYNYGGVVQTSSSSPFDGTTGVGVGTLANRPTTCTAGVFYWATNQGSWNSSGAGGQGLGYKCTATDTWATGANIYTPYDYPHPLTAGVSISSVSPAFGQQGAAVAVTLTGLGFQGGNATINAMSGITISGTSVVSDTSITATFTIAGGATLGDRSVTVTTDEGTSNAVTFEVLASGAVPTITAISPSSEDRGETASVTLTGTNFTGGSVSLSGTGVTTDNCKVVSATSITCDFIVAASTGWGLREVTVTNGSGTSNTANFFVSSPGIGPGRMWMR